MKIASVMPVTFMFKQVVVRDSECLISDHDVQILTVSLSLSAAIPAHAKVGMALAF